MAAVSWKNPVSANWNTPGDWSTGAVPASTDDVTIGGTGGYTVTLTTPPVTVNSLTISDASATLAIADPGGTDKITANFSNMGTVDVDATGTGGTGVTVGTTFTNQGTLVIGNSGITNATTVTVATLTNAGTIDLTGGSALATLDITGATPTTLVGSYVLQGNALLEVPSSVSPSGGSVTAIAGNAKLVLSGAQSRVAQSGSTTTNSGLTGLTSNAGTLAIQLGSSITTAAGLTNSGTIKVDNNYFGTGDTGGSTLAVGGALTNNAGAFLYVGNSGGITTASGVTASAGLSNAGTIYIIGGTAQASLKITGATTNTGSINLSDSVFSTTTNFTNANTVYVDESGRGGSTLTVGGTLLNEYSFSIGNTSLTTAATTVSAAAFSNFGGLAIYSGTTAATLKVSGAFTNGFNHTVDVDNSGAGGSSLTIGTTLTNNGYLYIGDTSLSKPTTVKAATLANTGTIGLTGGTAAATLNITGTAPTTLSGISYSLAGNALLEFGSGGVTAIGSSTSLTLNGAKALVALSTAPTTDSALTGLNSNAGTMLLENGAVLTTTVALDNSLNLEVDEYGSGGSSLTIGGALTNEDYFYVGSTNITTATTVSTGTLSNYGNLYLYSGAAAAILTDTGAFTNGPGDIVEVDYGAPGGSTLSIEGGLTNKGTFYIGYSGLTKATTVKAASLANTGTINLAGGVAATATATLNITGVAPVTLNGVSYSLAGNALLEFASGGVTAIGSSTSLTLNGSKALVALSSGLTTNSALAKLSSNAGTFLLENGAVLTTTVALDNSLNLEIDEYGSGGSSVTIGGALTNEDYFYVGSTNITTATTVSTGTLSNFDNLYLYSGSAAATLKVTGAFSNHRGDNVYIDYGGAGGSALTISGALTNNGTLDIGYTSLSKATAVKAASLTNTGIINLAGNTAAATLYITGAALTTLSSTYTLATNALLELGGGVTAIGSGASVTLNGAKALVALSSGLTTNSALTGLTSNAGIFLLENGVGLTTTVALDNSAQLEVDEYGSGGSSVTIGGTLTNEDYLYIGSTGLSAATAVTATAVSNFDNLYLYSGSAAATLSVTGALSNAVNSNIYVDYGGAGGSSLTIGGTLTNYGALNIGDTGLSKATTVKAASLANTGTIYMNESTAATATLDITGAATATLNGTYTLAGNALLEFGGGAVTAIGSAASLTLNGSKALVALSSGLTTNSALTKLSSNAGTLVLENGAAITTTTGLNNSSYLEVDYPSSGGSSLTIGGTLTNSGNVYVGYSSITSPTSLTVGALANTGGTIQVIGGSGTNTATLKATGASTDSGAITVYSGGALNLGNTLTVSGSLILYGGAVSGGTLAKSGSGVIEIASGYTGTLTGVTIGSGATFTALGTSTLFDNGITASGAVSGSGTATLDFTKTGTDSLTNISGFPVIGLANGAANSLTLTAANFGGLASGTKITINDGNSGNTVNGAGLPAADAIIVRASAGADVLTGGAGADVFYADGNTAMTGKGGANQFVFSAPGLSNTIADFNASSTNELVFSNSGFALGLSGASSTPQALPTTLFTSNATGAFSTTAQRFAYNTANGRLLYDSQGSTSGSTSQLVATLTNHPGITAASQLFFVS